MSLRSAASARLLVVSLLALTVAACVTPRPRRDGGDDDAMDEAAVAMPDAPPDMQAPPPDALSEAAVIAPDALDETEASTAPPDASDVVIAPDVVRPMGACAWGEGRPLTLPMDFVAGMLMGTSNNPTTSCTPGGAPGPEAVFPLVLTEGTGVDLSVTSAVDTVISVRRTCEDASSELGCSNDAVMGDMNPRFRGRLEAGTYSVVVDQVGGTTGGAFALTARSFPAFAWGTCRTARVLTGSGDPITMQDTTGGLERAGGCAAGAPSDSNALFYRVNVPVGGRLEVTVRPEDAADRMPWNAVLRVLPMCGALSCTASANDGMAGAPESITYINRTVEAQDLVIAVSSAEATRGGPFSIEVRVTPPPSNAACTMPTPLTDGTMLSRVSYQQALSSDLTVCRTNMPTGKMLYYSAAVPAGRRLSVTATTATPGRAAVRIFDVCAPATCLASSDDLPASGTAVSARFLNDSGATRNVLVGVLNNDPLATSVDIAATIADAPPAASCSTAPTASTTAPLRGEDLTDAGPALGACGLGAGKPARYYRVVVPGGQTLSVLAASTAGTPAPTLRILPDCTSTMCLATAMAGTAASNVVRWSNTDAGSRAVIIVASVSEAAARGDRFDLTVTLRPPAAYSMCPMARALTLPASLTGEDANDGRTSLAAVCLPAVTGGALFYRVEIPPGQAMLAVATPRTSSVGLRVLDACDSVGCVGSATGTTTAPATVSYTNPSTTMTKTLILAVSGPGTGTPPLFDLAVSARTPAANGTCSMATPLLGGMTLRGEVTSTGRDPSSTSCLPDFNLPSLYYRVTVPAANEFTFTLTPSNTMVGAPVVRLLSGCGATMCLGSNVTDPRTPPPPGIITGRYRNTTTMTENLILTVTPARAGDVSFDLSATFTALPYLAYLAPNSCEAMAGATNFTELFGDDVGARSVAMPFPFSYFGDAIQSFAPNTNGLVQLFAAPASASMTGTPSYINTAFEAGSMPTGVVTAFWDDLASDMGTSVVRYRDVTAAGSVPRHLTVEWSDVRLLRVPAGGPRLTFQLKLFADNSIEMHYCRLGDGSADYTGLSATVGAISLTGTRAIVLGANQAGIVSTMNAFRLVPTP